MGRYTKSTFLPFLYLHVTQWKLCVPVSDVASRQHLRSASRRLLVFPRHRLQTYRRRAFSVAGPSAWNSLPDNLRDSSVSRDSFCKLLKSYLFTRYWNIERIRGFTRMRYTNLLTYLLTYFSLMSHGTSTLCWHAVRVNYVHSPWAIKMCHFVFDNSGISRSISRLFVYQWNQEWILLRYIYFMARWLHKCVTSHVRKVCFI